MVVCDWLKKAAYSLLFFLPIINVEQCYISLPSEIKTDVLLN